jgi:hypothetical protein
LLHDLPVGEIVGQVTPLSAGADDPAEGVEDVSEVVFSLGCVGWEECQVREDQVPFLVGEVTWVCFARHAGRVLRIPT